MAKVLPLEGPHKKHHNHGKDASVPGDKKLPSEHWERHYDMWPRSNKVTPASAFNPRPGADRPSTHTKVNREDH